MTPAPEHERLAALYAYGVLDTSPEPGFEHITSLVTRLFQVPIAAVVLLDAERQWFKSIRGFDARETPRELSFCNHVLTADHLLTVPDTIEDPRFATHPFVTGEPHVRFYAGAPLHTPEGYVLGALCMADQTPREIGPAEEQLLGELATLVEDELLLRRVAQDLGQKTLPPPEGPATRVTERPEAPGFIRARKTAGPKGDPDSPTAGQPPSTEISTGLVPEHSRQIFEQASDAIFVYDLGGHFIDVNATACRMVGYEREELLSLRVSDIEVSFDPAKAPERWKTLAPSEVISLEGFNRRKDGSLFPAEARVSVVETAHGRLLLALVRDISERKQAEKLLQLRARQQQMVARLGASALSGMEVQALGNEVVQAIGSTLGVEICRILEHAPERGEFTIRATLEGPGPGDVEPVISARPDFAAGHALRKAAPVVVLDARSDHRFEKAPWLEAQGAVSGLNVTIGGDHSSLPVFGVVAAYTRKRRVFTEDDVYFVQAVANVLAATIAGQHALKALQAVEARYSRIAANTPGIVYQYRRDNDGTITIPFISESCRRLYGREPREVQDHPNLLVESIHPDDRPGLVEKMRFVETNLTPLHWQGRHLIPGGEVRWVRIDSQPERQPDGSIICDGTIIDVTEEEQRKEALRESEGRFRAASAHSPFPMMLHTEDGEVLLVNDAWTHITGYEADRIRSMDDWLRLAYETEESREEMREFLIKAREYIGAVENPGRRIRCAGGEHRVWDISNVSLGRLPDGRWLRLATAIDVTEQRRQEAELRQAKEEAERANAAKSLFLSRMSHELRTPLNAILGFGQLLETSRLEDEDALAVRHILKGGKHLLMMVDEVLDLARVESGELALNLADVSLDQLLPECVALVERMARAFHVTCKVAPTPASHASVRADEQRLRQVVLNLLSNAIKYNRPGGRVTVSCHRPRKGRLRLKIKDTGPGISPENLDRLFVPFERLGQEHGEVEGTGLGLVVSRQLMEVMDGSLNVESKAGVGSTFSIELPLAENAKHPSGDELLPSLLPVVPPAEVVNATLLYIEDNVSNVQVVKTVLERLRPQWRFLSARDGASGLALAREQVPGVILLDLQLPGMNGDQVLTELRADPITHALPVLLLSADATTHSRERLLTLGATGYLSKPFEIARLLEMLDALLAGVAAF